MNADQREHQTDAHGGEYVRSAPQPLAVFQHLDGLPSEAGEGGEAAEEADGDGHAHVRRDHHAVHGELAKKAEQKASGKIHHQRAGGKRCRGAMLHDALQTVAGKRADGSENGDPNDSQRDSFRDQNSTAPRQSASGTRESKVYSREASKRGFSMGLTSAFWNRCRVA